METDRPEAVPLFAVSSLYGKCKTLVLRPICSGFWWVSSWFLGGIKAVPGRLSPIGLPSGARLAGLAPTLGYELRGIPFLEPLYPDGYGLRLGRSLGVAITKGRIPGFAGMAVES